MNFDVGKMPENTCEKQAMNINEDLGQMSCHDKLDVPAEKQGMDLEDPDQIRHEDKCILDERSECLFIIA